MTGRSINPITPGRSLICAFVLVIINIQDGVSATIYKNIDPHDGATNFSDKPFYYHQYSYISALNNIRHNKKISVKKSQLLGQWALYGQSLLLNGDFIAREELWQFDEHGILTIKQSSSPNSLQTDIPFRLFQDTLELQFERQDDRKRQVYRFVSYDENSLVLYLIDEKRYLFLQRKQGAKTARKSSMPVYRRDQTAKLLVSIACRGSDEHLMPDSMPDLNKTQNDKNKPRTSSVKIDKLTHNSFLNEIGIIQFERKKYRDSIDLYQNDPIFIGEYQPQILRSLIQCNAPERLTWKRRIPSNE